MLDIIKNEQTIASFAEVYQNHMMRIKLDFMYPGRKYDGFIYILSGCCDYTFTTGDTFSVHAGDILYLAKNAVYKMNVDCEYYSFVVINFDFATSQERRSFRSSVKNSTETERLFRKTLIKYTSLSAARNPECMSILYQLYANIIKNTLNSYIGGSRQKIKEIEQYITDHIGDNTLRVSNLAEISGYTETYFRRIFSEYYGVSPIRYINSARVSYAKRLLRYSSWSLEEIAEKSGFSSLQYFSTVFRELTGITPARFRVSNNIKSDIT